MGPPGTVDVLYNTRPRHNNWLRTVWVTWAQIILYVINFRLYLVAVTLQRYRTTSSTGTYLLWNISRLKFRNTKTEVNTIHTSVKIKNEKSSSRLPFAHQLFFSQILESAPNMIALCLFWMQDISIYSLVFASTIVNGCTEAFDKHRLLLAFCDHSRFVLAIC